VVNQRLVSIQRLRNLCRDDADRALVEAALAWAAQWRRPRAGPSPATRADATEGVQLFREIRADARRADEIFRAHGWLKPPTERSGKSQAPDILAPINFAFRLRQLLGVGARAEAVRFLLTVDAPSATAQVIGASAGYAKRNVQEALAALRSADVIDAVTVGNQQRYRIDRERWATLLGLAADSLPSERDWRGLLHALRVLLRWLEDDRNDKLSEYMLASEAHVVADEIVPELRRAGLRVAVGARPGADYWRDFVELASAAVDALG
jgi:DNA-binding transcriptional ArsR family regulator